jgi:hypothetical protein
VIIGTGTWINIGYQRAQMESALEDNVLIISNTIDKSLANAMLDGKSREVQHILEAVGGGHNIREIKIFSTNGVILKSSKRWQIGRRVDPTTQKWYLEGKFKKPIKRRDEGIFSVLFPIENTEPCFRCHGPAAALNGILAVDVSMIGTQEKVGELSKTMILWAFGVTATLAIFLSLFLTRYVTNPIQELIATMERAERGLEARVQVKSADDIGRLGEAFNSLLSKLERARRRVERYHYEQMKRADRLASIGEMAAGIAHEIKNPLAGVAGVIQVLKKDIPAGDPKRVVLDEVLSQVERMDKAVRNLLSFARPPEPRMTMVDVNELVSRLLDFLAPQFAKNGIMAERRLTAGLPWLVMDPDLMQQAILNIALNAIKAMREVHGGKQGGGAGGRRTRRHHAGLLGLGRGDLGREPGQDLQSLLHDPPAGDGPGAVHHPAHRGAAPRRHQRAEPAGARGRVHDELSLPGEGCRDEERMRHVAEDPGR